MELPGSFLATRCLVQLAEECKAEWPEISRVIVRDFYVDLVSETETEELAEEIALKTSEVLERGKFALRKWRFNSSKILERLQGVTNDALDLQIVKDKQRKTLGLMW